VQGRHDGLVRLKRQTNVCETVDGVLQRASLGLQADSS